jgi:heme/copper-type cytochrome/quinol oxidase subunit 2
LHSTGYGHEKNRVKISQGIARVLIEIRNTQLPNTVQRLNFIIIIIIIIIISIFFGATILCARSVIRFRSSAA